MAYTAQLPVTSVFGSTGTLPSLEAKPQPVKVLPSMEGALALEENKENAVPFGLPTFWIKVPSAA